MDDSRRHQGPPKRPATPQDPAHLERARGEPPEPPDQLAEDEAFELALVRAIQTNGRAAVVPSPSGGRRRRGGKDATGLPAWSCLLQRYQDRLYAVCLRMVGNPETAADLTQDSMVKIIQGLGSYDSRSKLSTWVIRIAMNTCLSYLRGQKHRKHASLNALLEEPAARPPASAVPRRRVSNPPDPVSQVATTGSSTSGATEHNTNTPATAPVVGGPAAFLGPGSGSSNWQEQSREQSPDASVEQEERRAQVAVALASLPHEQRAILLLRDVQGLDYDQIGDALDLAVGTVKSRLFRARLALREAIESQQRD